MARKKKEPVVETVEVEAPEEVVEEVADAPVTEPVEAEPAMGETHDKIPDVVFSNINLINVLDMKSLLNAGLNENTIIRCIDTNDMYAPTKVGSVCKIMTQLDADGDIVKLATT